jgi:hypothetical protein
MATVPILVELIFPIPQLLLFLFLIFQGKQKAFLSRAFYLKSTRSDFILSDCRFWFLEHFLVLLLCLCQLGYLILEFFLVQPCLDDLGLNRRMPL